MTNIVVDRIELKEFMEFVHGTSVGDSLVELTAELIEDPSAVRFQARQAGFSSARQAAVLYRAYLYTKAH